MLFVVSHFSRLWLLCCFFLGTSPIIAEHTASPGNGPVSKIVQLVCSCECAGQGAALHFDLCAEKFPGTDIDDDEFVGGNFSVIGCTDNQFQFPIDLGGILDADCSILEGVSCTGYLHKNIGRPRNSSVLRNGEIVGCEKRAIN